MDDDNARAVEAALAQEGRLLDYARRVLRDHHEAEDVFQEVALRARDAPRGAHLRSWLRAVCYRLAVDRLRAGRRRRRIAALAALVERPDTPDDLERASEAARLRRWIAELDEPYRSAIRLRYLEELDFSEVAQRLGTVERTARTWVGRGLARLRAISGGSS